MKSKLLLLSLAAVAIIAIGVSLGIDTPEQAQYQPREGKIVIQKEGYKGALEYLALIRNNYLTGNLEMSDVLAAEEEVILHAKMGSKGGLNLLWSEMGPDNVGGRTRSILFDATDPNTIYVGSVSGGLFKSTTGGTSWAPIDDLSRSLAITAIAQGSNGDLYVGTGEGLLGHLVSGSANGGTFFPGKGIYHSTDGVNFSLLPSTIPSDTNSSTGSNFTFVHDLEVASNGTIYAGTNRGLFISIDNGLSWTRKLLVKTTDIEIGSDGTVIASVSNKFYIYNSSNDQFEFPAGAPQAVGRLELAIAPSDPNYIYAAAVYGSSNDPAQDGNLQGIYRSTDKGQTWTTIVPGGSLNINPYRDQGVYNNALAVFPNNKDKVLIGGIDLYEWQHQGNFTQKTLWVLDPSSPLYIHADQHTYEFHPTNPNVLLVGSDGGISLSTDGGATFATRNINYNSVQFYTVAAHPDGGVLGGTQDNQSQYISLQGNSPMNAVQVGTGDGGHAAVSNINTDVLFTTSYYGTLYRTPDRGANLSTFYDTRADGFGLPGQAGFVTPIALWESDSYTQSTDSIDFFPLKDYSAGDTIVARSRNNQYPFEYITPVAVDSGIVVKLQDPIESRLVVGAHNGIWLTRGCLDFSGTPDWVPLAKSGGVNSFAGTTQSMAWSADGDVLFVGTTNGQLYRVSNILSANTNEKLDAENTSHYAITVRNLSLSGASGRPITSIAVDPNDANNIVVTTGQYGRSVYVYKSSNALVFSPTFSSAQGSGSSSLPKMPVYGSIIEKNNPNIVLLATEFGIYSTSDITASNVLWVKEDIGMPNVPCHMIIQQTNNWPTRYVQFLDGGQWYTKAYPGTQNHGAVYVGTHGRGIWKSEFFVGVEEEENLVVSHLNPTLKAYPNPAQTYSIVEYSIHKSSKVYVNLFNLSGQLVKRSDLGSLPAGKYEEMIDLNDLNSGTYIAQIVAGQDAATVKIIVSK